MIKDLNKGISNITYNHLNLPTRVTINGKLEADQDKNGITSYIWRKTKNFKALSSFNSELTEYVSAPR